MNINGEKKKTIDELLKENNIKIENNSIKIVIEATGTKDQLFEKISNWIKMKFIDKECAVSLLEKETGTINGIGMAVLMNKASKKNFSSYFTYTFEIKDNKFRMKYPAAS
jgi:hypothetical protein